MTATTTRTTGLTYEDLLTTPEGDGNRYELFGGELVVTASPAKRHAWIQTRLVRQLGNHVEQLTLGEVFGGPVDVRLTNFDVVVPDIIFLRADRLHIFGDRFVDGAPDLIVEILSPSTRSRDLTVKMQLYARAGVAEYWIVDPETSAVAVYSLSSQGSYELVESGDRVRSQVLPEFLLNPRTLFEGID